MPSVSCSHTVVDETVDRVIARFYSDVLEEYWPPERRHVEEGYRSLPFPFEEIDAPDLAISMDVGGRDWICRDGVAVRALEKAEGPARFEFRRERARAWGRGRQTEVRTVHWALALRVGRVK